MYRTNAIMVATYKEIKRTILCEPKIQVVRAYKNPQKILWEDNLLHLVRKGPYPGGGYQETAIIPDGLDDSTAVMRWKGLWVMAWRRVVGCGGLVGGLLGKRLII